jgi:DNA topoisomerase-3
LVELEEPASYDARWKPWRLEALPMIPDAFKLRPVEGTRDQLRAVTELLRDRRFTEVVNACDAGREGELIFRYVYELAGSRLPARRLWISSLTDEAIRQGFGSLRAAAEYQPLADAARCRSEADWLVGMNATRAVTITRRSAGPRVATTATAARPPARGARGTPPRSPVYSIGRVQTPTLALVVRREQAIRAFVPRDYWELRGAFKVPGAAFTAGWGIRAETGKGIVTRFASKVLADGVVGRCAKHGRAADADGPVVESVRQRKGREPAPQLFDLTSLQRTANRRYGLSATRTLEAAQALYERYKALTYPRTDSRYLSHDLGGELPKLFRGVAEIPEYASFAQRLLDNPPAKSRRVFDDAKVQDHHAIIPTGKAVRLEALPTEERRIFDLVVRRFLGVFYPDAEFAMTDAVIRVGADTVAAKPDSMSEATAGDTSPVEDVMLQELPAPPDRYFARGRVRLVAGWQDVALYGDSGGQGSDGGDGKPRRRGGKDAPGESEESATTLPPLTEGQRLDGAFETLAKQTRPPPRHTEATLLSAMEYAGRDIEDEALRAAMKDTGLGTPATRAATIETLVKRGFITREGKQVVATPTGIDLIDTLPVASLASPELTGAWEARLARIARRQDTRAAFMTDIVRYVGDMVDAIRRAPPGKVASAAPARAPLAPVAAARVAAASSPAPAAATPAAIAATALPCPRCRQGNLITGKRGWGCSRWRQGCAFVVWFEFAGRRLTDAQLRDLVAKGKTRKATWSTANRAKVSGRLVLDLTASAENGAARLE